MFAPKRYLIQCYTYRLIRNNDYSLLKFCIIKRKVINMYGGNTCGSYRQLLSCKQQWHRTKENQIKTWIIFCVCSSFCQDYTWKFWTLIKKYEMIIWFFQKNENNTLKILCVRSFLLDFPSPSEYLKEKDVWEQLKRYKTKKKKTIINNSHIAK